MLRSTFILQCIFSKNKDVSYIITEHTVTRSRTLNVDTMLHSSP